jgi:hypothetical protein
MCNIIIKCEAQTELVLIVFHMFIQSVYESQLLALQVKMYYGIQSGLKFNYVRMFNNAPDSFRHADLIREFDNYKKDLKEKLQHQDAQDISPAK